MRIDTTAIPGLLIAHLTVHADERGWFKEGWHREAARAAGVPDLGPVQLNISHNGPRGVTRGIHAEPWDKWITVAAGRVFAAWLDLRDGDSFGTIVTQELTHEHAVFVPRGVGNSYQTLTDNAAYAYLVNDHWRPDVRYLATDLQQPGIAWPIPLDQAIVSAKDLANPPLAEVTPLPPKPALVVGSRGQLGRALLDLLPTAVGVDVDELDLTDTSAVRAWAWREYSVVYNCAAYTAVDAAESDAAAAWALNATAVATLAEVTGAAGVPLVHVSTDYVFDGTATEHDETEPVAPLGVYGASKAAGEAALVANPQSWLIRTSWLIGEGPNFVRTMARLAASHTPVDVVDDQVGRLSFASEVARAAIHLSTSQAPYGTYHVSSAGPAQSWAEVAAAVYSLCGADPALVTPVSSAHYFASRPGSAPRPSHSTFALAKLRATGFEPAEAAPALATYVAGLLEAR